MPTNTSKPRPNLYLSEPRPANDPNLSRGEFENYMKSVAPEIRENIKAGITLKAKLSNISESLYVSEELVEEYLELKSKLGGKELEQCNLAKNLLLSKVDKEEITKEQYDADLRLI